MKKALPKHLMCFVFAALLVLTTILTTMTGQFEMKVQAEGTQMSVVSTEQRSGSTGMIMLYRQTAGRQAKQ